MFSVHMHACQDLSLARDQLELEQDEMNMHDVKPDRHPQKLSRVHLLHWLSVQCECKFACTDALVFKAFTACTQAAAVARVHQHTQHSLPTSHWYTDCIFHVENLLICPIPTSQKELHRLELFAQVFDGGSNMFHTVLVQDIPRMNDFFFARGQNFWQKSEIWMTAALCNLYT